MGLRDRLSSFGPGEIAVITFGLTALFGALAGALSIELLEPLVSITPIFGWFILTPIAALGGWGSNGTEQWGDTNSHRSTDTSNRQSSDATAEPTDPVEELRRRYAEGEIDEVAFERRLETVLATEDADPETARERLANGSELGVEASRERK